MSSRTAAYTETARVCRRSFVNKSRVRITRALTRHTRRPRAFAVVPSLINRGYVLQELLHGIAPHIASFYYFFFIGKGSISSRVNPASSAAAANANTKTLSPANSAASAHDANVPASLP